MKIYFSLVVLLASFNAWSQEGEGKGAYAFGGACSSQGSWTQSALLGTKALQKITAQLRDDGNCKGLAASVQTALAQVSASVQAASDSPKDVTALSQLPGQISALQSYAALNPQSRGVVLKLMMDKAIQGASISSKVTARDTMANGLMDFGSRLQVSTSTGLDLLNGVIGNIPQINECLMGENSQAMGSFIALSAQVAAAFAGSGQDGIASKLALTISKITNLQRDMKFSKVLRKLNQQEFLASMACLMEVTSESYCSARDAMSLFKKGMQSLKSQPGSGDRMTANNPFAGFYVLNTHVPNVTRWLQKVQIGVDPKLPTDATFQNNILDEVNNYQKSVKSLLGAYNFALGTLHSQSNSRAKQNTVLKLIKSITDGMVSGGFGDNDRRNFFTTSRKAMSIPFYLIKMEIPDQVAGRAQGMMPMGYDQWLEGNVQTLKIFEDPDSLIIEIGLRMKELMQEANVASIEYFNQWFIVDKAASVNESVIDIQYTVKDSLIAIEAYLGILQQKMSSMSGGDPSIIPSIVDTRSRIQTILSKYKALDQMGERMRHLNPKDITDAKILTEPLEAYEELTKTVYEVFMVQLARSGFLANRMSNFVNQDYILLVRNKVNFTQAQQDLFTAVGMSGLQKMLQTYNGNPANVQTDLNLALTIDKGNIEALETLLKDSLVNAIASAKLVSEGGNSAAWDSMKRLVKNAWDYNKGIPLHALGWAFGENILMELYNHNDRYTFNSADSIRSPESEFQNSKAVYSQLCVQALAFPNQNGLEELCRGAVLESPLKDMGGASMSYNQRLNSYLDNLTAAQKSMSEGMRKSFNHSERICALRDYNRQNMVLFMTLGQNRSNR